MNPAGLDNFRAFKVPSEKVTIRIPKNGRDEAAELEEVHADTSVHFLFTWELTETGERPLKAHISFTSQSSAKGAAPMLRLEFEGTSIKKVPGETTTFEFERQISVQRTIKERDGSKTITMTREYHVEVSNLPADDRLRRFLEMYCDKPQREWWA